MQPRSNHVCMFVLFQVRVGYTIPMKVQRIATVDFVYPLGDTKLW